MSFCVEEHWSMHPSGLFCTCSPLFPTQTSGRVNLPSCSVSRDWTNSDSSNLWIVVCFHLFCWAQTNRWKIPLLSDKLLKWSPFPALHSLPDLLVFVVPNLTLVLLEPSYVLVPLKDEFGDLLIKIRALGLLSVVFKVGEIPLSHLGIPLPFGLL